MQAGSRNCHAETPAARAITTSSRRLATTKAAIEPKRAVNGSTSSQMLGTRKTERRRTWLRRTRRPDRAGEEFEIGDGADQQDEEREDRQHHHGEAPGEIEGERAADGEHAGSAAPCRGRGCAAEQAGAAVRESRRQSRAAFRRSRLHAREDQADAEGDAASGTTYRPSTASEVVLGGAGQDELEAPNRDGAADRHPMVAERCWRVVSAWPRKTSGMIAKRKALKGAGQPVMQLGPELSGKLLVKAVIGVGIDQIGGRPLLRPERRRGGLPEKVERSKA